ncbi:Bax inhibitor 1 [Sarotherodon galilaeus]
MNIYVKCAAQHIQIQDIIISGPMNMTKHRTTHDEFVLRWTPLKSHLGDHFPVCFAVESVTGSGVYQSEMRCAVLDVRKEGIKTNVICTESTMRVEIDKSSFRGLHEDHLRLSEPSNTLCSLERYSNSTRVIGIIPLNACGTQIEEDDENLIFKNEITTVDDNTDLITRKHQLEVEFYCQYPKKGNVRSGFTAHRKNVSFEFYPNNHFQRMIDPNSYPLEYDVGEKIYMEIDASSTVNNTEIFVESCRASPYDNPNYHPTYSIIKNGCPVDSTVMTHAPDNKRQFRFCIEAFKFIGLHDQVYISCSVMVCEAGNPNTRCSQGCINSTPNAHHHSHCRKRGAIMQTAQHFISQGNAMDLNLVFIAGCLLAAVAMVCGVLMFRVKYQALSSRES